MAMQRPGLHVALFEDEIVLGRRLGLARCRGLIGIRRLAAAGTVVVVAREDLAALYGDVSLGKARAADRAELDHEDLLSRARGSQAAHQRLQDRHLVPPGRLD